MTVLELATAPDPGIRQVLAELHAALAAQGADWLVIGAQARELVVRHAFGRAGRATRDVDLAVALADWAAFEALRGRLLAAHGFAATPGVVHRLAHAASGVQVDLVPFGGVERAGHEIAWPPDARVVMNVAGYAEALACALRVRIDAALVVPVVSLPGLALLKLLAWHDRGAATRKDAQDLYALLGQYGELGNAARLYDDAGLLAALDFDVGRAGAVLLGRDVAALARPDTLAQARALLAQPARARLAADMVAAHRHAEGIVEAVEQRLADFARGLG